MKHFALAGNPNSGKTTLFNSLTGSTAHVGNWPGVTVDKKEGLYKKSKEKINIVDLPGIYSLSPYTSEEVISRHYILDEKPDCVINIVDATNIERNLYLTTQLLEIDIPVVVALNMMDVVRSNGDEILVEELSKKLGVPCVEISALKSDNIDHLMDVAIEASKTPRSGVSIIENKDLAHLISDIVVAFKGKNIPHPIFHAVKLVELDELEVKDHPDLVPMVDGFKSWFSDETFKGDFEALIADARYKYICKYFTPSFIKRGNKETDAKSDKIDRILTNKWLGIPIFIVILFLLFHLTFSENFLYLGGLFNNVSPCFEGSIFEGLFYTSDGINSPGVILTNLVSSITGWFSSCVSSWLSGAPAWVNGFIVNGILAGVFAVINFLPQILLLFLFFSILEDSGYMARVAFILDRILRKFGLSGRALMPMIMGFGCAVPAIVNTRTLVDDKEKIATIRVIPFFSCGAKLPIITAIGGGIAQYFGVANVDLITLGMYIMGVIVAILAVLIMKQTSLRGKVPPFILELPNYHKPQFRSLMVHLWDKAKHFLQKAFTIILASTIVIWFLEHFSWNWQYLNDTEISGSILASLGQLIQPLFTPLGFGSQLAKYGWVFAVAAITGIIAKENVVGTLGVLAATIISSAEIPEGTEAVMIIIRETGITLPALLGFIAFNMLTIPCTATLATARAELPKKRFGWTILFWLVVSFIVASAFYLVGSWWWTLFIYIGAFVLAIILIVRINKMRDAKKTLKGA